MPNRHNNIGCNIYNTNYVHAYIAGEITIEMVRRKKNYQIKNIIIYSIQYNT